MTTDSRSTTTGVVLRPQLPPEDLRAVVEAAEDAGVAELWLWEDCFRQGALTTAAAALAWSTRLRVGVGLLPVPLRNPALAAMEIATVARMFPERLVVVLGHGVPEWMAQVGAAVDSPVTLLREYATAVRSLLAGETVDVQGRYVRLSSVTLDWPPPVAPRLLIGARGPRTMALAGEVSDGVLLDTVTDPEVVRRARGVVGSDRHITAYAPVDDLSALAEIRASLGAAGADTVVFEAPEDSPDPRPLIEAMSAR